MVWAAPTAVYHATKNTGWKPVLLQPAPKLSEALTVYEIVARI